MLRAALTALFAGSALAAPVDVPPRKVGPFEITAHAKRVGDSGRFLRTGNPFGTQMQREYTVTYAGRKLELPVAGDRHWQVLELPAAPRPALLLASGPHLHLVVDAGGRPEVRALAPEAGNSGAQWLDANGGQPAEPIKGFGPDRVDAPPTLRLEGGTLLYLRNRLVLDLRTLTTVAVEPWWREGQGNDVVEMNASNGPAIALSPGRTRFVVAGDGQDFRRNGERFAALLVIDLATGRPEGLRVDPRLATFETSDRIDAAFVARHFRWERSANGRERLVPR